jgi:hypothetical protein
MKPPLQCLLLILLSCVAAQDSQPSLLPIRPTDIPSPVAPTAAKPDPAPTETIQPVTTAPAADDKPTKAPEPITSTVVVSVPTTVDPPAATDFVPQPVPRRPLKTKTPVPSKPEQKKAALNIGLIVGITMGILAVLLACGWLYWVRRKKDKDEFVGDLPFYPSGGSSVTKMASVPPKVAPPLPAVTASSTHGLQPTFSYHPQGHRDPYSPQTPGMHPAHTGPVQGYPSSIYPHYYTTNAQGNVVYAVPAPYGYYVDHSSDIQS